MKQADKLKYLRNSINELEKFCIQNKIDCKLMFTGGMAWTGRVHYAKNILDSSMSLEEMRESRQWSGIIFEITFKDSDKGDNINCVKEIVDYLRDDLKGY